MPGSAQLPGPLGGNGTCGTRTWLWRGCELGGQKWLRGTAASNAKDCMQTTKQVRRHMPLLGVPSPPACLEAMRRPVVLTPQLSSCEAGFCARAACRAKEVALVARLCAWTLRCGARGTRVPSVSARPLPPTTQARSPPLPRRSAGLPLQQPSKREVPGAVLGVPSTLPPSRRLKRRPRTTTPSNGSKAPTPADSTAERFRRKRALHAAQPGGRSWGGEPFPAQLAALRSQTIAGMRAARPKPWARAGPPEEPFNAGLSLENS